MELLCDERKGGVQGRMGQRQGAGGGVDFYLGWGGGPYNWFWDCGAVWIDFMYVTGRTVGRQSR